MLSSAKGSLLDDTSLIDTLQQSKTTSQTVKESLRISQETEKILMQQERIIDHLLFVLQFYILY